MKNKKATTMLSLLQQHQNREGDSSKTEGVIVAFFVATKEKTEL
jgi:hypothetical protein